MTRTWRGEFREPFERHFRYLCGPLKLCSPQERRLEQRLRVLASDKPHLPVAQVCAIDDAWPGAGIFIGGSDGPQHKIVRRSNSDGRPFLPADDFEKSDQSVMCEHCGGGDRSAVISTSAAGNVKQCLRGSRGRLPRREVVLHHLSGSL